MFIWKCAYDGSFAFTSVTVMSDVGLQYALHVGEEPVYVIDYAKCATIFLIMPCYCMQIEGCYATRNYPKDCPSK
jgi:hypothetical protein